MGRLLKYNINTKKEILHHLGSLGIRTVTDLHFNAMQKIDDNHNVIVLFDMDGTLTPSRCPANQSMIDLLRELRKTVTVGIVSGSDEAAINRQMGEDIQKVTDYIFAENGTVTRHHGSVVGKDASIQQFLGEENLQKLINFILKYISELKIPKKRGTFIEYRNGLINVSPIGRNCSSEERIEFFLYDKQHQIRQQMRTELESKFATYDLHFAIGGQISIDCYPKGWDKRYCLQHVEHQFEKIYFIGDRTEIGGNDHDIYCDPRTIGVSVAGPDETEALIREMFL